MLWGSPDIARLDLIDAEYRAPRGGTGQRHRQGARHSTGSTLLPSRPPRLMTPSSAIRRFHTSRAANAGTRASRDRRRPRARALKPGGPPLPGGQSRLALRACAESPLRLVRGAGRTTTSSGLSRAYPLNEPAIRNSLLPSAPSIGLSVIPSTPPAGLRGQPFGDRGGRTSACSSGSRHDAALAHPALADLETAA